jgi:hypothetical protein
MIKYVAQADKARKYRSALDSAGALIGSVRNCPADLASNPQYLNDFGSRPVVLLDTGPLVLLAL